jgi:hypothetical protein
MHNLMFHPDVYNEIQDAYSWYENKTPGLGKDFIAELETSYIAIEKMPATWPLLTKRTHRFILKRFPYGILYVIRNGGILEVIAVMHLKRKPGYWKDRVK